MNDQPESQAKLKRILIVQVISPTNERGEAARARLRGMLAGMLTLPKMLRKRRAIQSARTTPLEEIERMLTPTTPGGTD